MWSRMSPSPEHFRSRSGSATEGFGISMHKSIVTGSFDDLRSSDVRFLEEAAKCGELHVFLWSDEVVRRLDGSARSSLWVSGRIFCRRSAMSIRFILLAN